MSIITSAVIHFVLSTVILLLFIKYFPIQKAVNSQLLPFETLRKKYSKWDITGLLLFALLTPLFTFLFYHVLLWISSLRFQSMIRDGYVKLPDPMMWLVLAFFLAMAIALFSLLVFTRNLPTLKQAEFIAYMSRKYQLDMMKASNFIVRFLILTMGLFYFFGINYYSHFGEDKITISYFFEPFTHEYEYDEVKQITHVQKLIAPNGNKVHDPHYTVHFSNGDVWNSRMSNQTEPERDSMILRFVSEKSGVGIVETEF